MIQETTITEIKENQNTGVEYEIALFYKLLLSVNNIESGIVLEAINKRGDAAKVKTIARKTNIAAILEEINNRNYNLVDVSFETQNDEIGPSDIVLTVETENGLRKQLGLSVKYANSCTLNSTSARFITEEQRQEIESVYPSYKNKYIKFMRAQYGNAVNWHRKRCPVTSEFIDLLRDAVIKHWNERNDKRDVLSAAFQDTSPIEFWVVTYTERGYKLNASPVCIDLSRPNDVIAEKHAGQYVTFSLDGVVYGKMQVKFNNGLLELNLNHRGERKKEIPDEIIDNLEFINGDPFGSWNFSVVG